MPNTIISGNATSGVTLASGDAYVLLGGASHVTSSTNVSITGSTGNNVSVLGDLVHVGSSNVFFLNDVNNFNMVVGTTGSVISNSFLIQDTSTSSTSFDLVNNGLMSGSSVLFTQAQNANIVNNGTMAATGVGSTVLFLNGSNSHVTNTGTMTGSQAIVMNPSAASAQVINSGDILT